ncbi:Uncharacterised protein [Shigella sonnei]|nr:Uncharacterised protein [Shigella sonnei]
MSPINNTNRINPSASATLSSDNTRMPLSTPEVTEIVAIITDKAISAAFAAIESGISNSTLKP